MDAESNYESDISESWSLIDINLNEESLITNDASSTFSTLEKICSPAKKSIKSGLQDYEKNYKELNKLDCSQISDSDSIFKKHDLEPFRKKKVIQPLQSLDDSEKNDSGDTESIEILDMDGNYPDSEMDRLDISINDHFNFSAYQSDDEESSLEETVHYENGSNNSIVLKRKRKRTVSDLEDVVNCIYSENACMNDTKEVSGRLTKAKNHLVYKHNRNNAANTVLSLSVGVIFAGVACIAIGHFLGVQDAAETAGELVETLKKLQVENAALHSSVVHLKEALLTLETKSKFELPLNQPHNHVSYEKMPKISPLNKQMQADLNNAALSEIFSSLNSIEWLFKLQNIFKKGTETEKTEIDINALGKHIHDRFDLLKEERKKTSKLLETNTDLLLVIKKLVIELKKVMKKLSSSHDNIQVIHNRLIKLKHSINHNLNKIFRDSSCEVRREKTMPITELELQTVHCIKDYKILWDFEKNTELEVLYKFPQPQNYYEFESRLNSKTSNSSVKNVNKENERKNEKKSKSEEEKNKQKKQKKNWKSGKEVKVKKKDKKEKRGLTKKFEKNESECVKHISSLRSINMSYSSCKKNQEKNGTYKPKVKKIKNFKLKNNLLPKLKEESDSKKIYDPFCSESQCFNLSGYWVFKWADGRKEFRRHQALGDWQFDRAKARKDVRHIGFNNNWQFERAKARKELRNEAFDGNWQLKRALARESNRNYDKTHRIKFTKNSRKDFFQEKFSWI